MQGLIKRSIVAAAGALCLAATPAFAEEISIAEAQTADAYNLLAQAFTSDVIADLVFEKDLTESFRAVFASDPELQGLEADCPGFTKGYLMAARPILYKAHMSDYAWYRGELISLFQGQLSEQDAQGAAEFYGSALGQKLIGRAVAGQTFENSTREILEEEADTISAEAYEADKSASVSKVLETMTEAEIEELNGIFGSAEWFQAILALQPAIQSLTLEMTNRDLSPEDSREFDARTDAFTEQHLAACDAH